MLSPVPQALDPESETQTLKTKTETRNHLRQNLRVRIIKQTGRKRFQCDNEAQGPRSQMYELLVDGSEQVSPALPLSLSLSLPLSLSRSLALARSL